MGGRLILKVDLYTSKYGSVKVYSVVKLLP